MILCLFYLQIMLGLLSIRRVKWKVIILLYAFLKFVSEFGLTNSKIYVFPNVQVPPLPVPLVRNVLICGLELPVLPMLLSRSWIYEILEILCLSQSICLKATSYSSGNFLLGSIEVIGVVRVLDLFYLWYLITLLGWLILSWFLDNHERVRTFV